VLDPGEASAERVLTDLADVVDRIKALEGTLSVANADGGVRITAELPCA
jgi:signal transduction histidine kinase